MTHKQKCITYCKEYLQQLDLLNIFSQTEFDSYYKKHLCHLGNAYAVGLNAADYLIHTIKFLTPQH